jgi:hypothetical protein
VNATDIRTIAARLGIDEFTGRRVQARGYLLSLALEESEIRDSDRVDAVGRGSTAHRTTNPRRAGRSRSSEYF